MPQMLGTPTSCCFDLRADHSSVQRRRGFDSRHRKTNGTITATSDLVHGTRTSRSLMTFTPDMWCKKSFCFQKPVFCPQIWCLRCTRSLALLNNSAAKDGVLRIKSSITDARFMSAAPLPSVAFQTSACVICICQGSSCSQGLFMTTVHCPGPSFIFFPKHIDEARVFVCTDQ